MGKEGHYKENSYRVREIYGYEKSDKTVNIHHIVLRSDYKTKEQRKFWDDSVPSGRFDINGKGNIFPVTLEEHARINAKINGDGMPSGTRRRNPESQKKKTKKRKKEKKIIKK